MFKISTLINIVDIYDKQRVPLSEMERSSIKGKYPYCGANGIIDHINKYIYDGEYILLAEDGGSYGKNENSCYPMNGKFWVNNHAHVLKAKDNVSINKYVYYALNYFDLRAYIVGSTRVKLNQDKLKNIQIPLPPLPVQRKIAEILGAADAAIEKVDQAIAATERLKKGLMQQLLTKGIGHTQFKNTELGKIPKEWELVRLGELGTLQYGYTETSTTVNTGCKYLRITDIESNGIVKWDSVPFCKIDGNNYNKYNLEKGDLLFARIGSTTGKSCFIDKNIKGVFASYLIRFRPTVAVNQKYLFYYSQTLFYWNQANKNKEGQLKKGINAPILKSINIILPTVAEQNMIVTGIDSFNDKLAILTAKINSISAIKHKLMTDLLTGKRSVKV